MKSFALRASVSGMKVSFGPKRPWSARPLRDAIMAGERVPASSNEMVGPLSS